jgi:hypothetical protein
MVHTHHHDGEILPYYLTTNHVHFMAFPVTEKRFSPGLIESSKNLEQELGLHCPARS